jgi:predicted ester cyclase
MTSTSAQQEEQPMRALFDHYALSQDPEFFLDDAVFAIQALPGGPSTGRQAIAQMHRRLYQEAFSEARREVRNVVVDHERCLGALEFTFRGRHTGELLGRAPTYRTVELPMLAVYELAPDGIQAGRLYFDLATLHRQLGPAV